MRKKVWLIVGVVMALGQIARSEDEATKNLSTDIAAVRNEARALFDSVPAEDELPRDGLAELAKVWSKKNPRALFEWATNEGSVMLDSDDHKSFYREVGTHMARQHAKDALAFVDKKFRLMNPGDDDSRDALLIESILKVVLFADPDGVVKWMKEDEGRARLLRMLDDRAAGLFSTNAPAYVIDLAKTDAYVAEECLNSAFNALAKRDWKAAAKEISAWKVGHDQEIFEGRHYRRMVQALARNCPERDTEEALAWLKGFDAEAEEAVRNILMGEKSPTEALTFLQETLDDSGRLLPRHHTIITNAAAKDPVKTMAWVAQLPEGPDKRAAIQAGLYPWARMDPQSALAWTESIESAHNKAQAQETVVKVWPSVDLKAAGEWIEKLPDGPLKETGAEAMFSELSSGRSSDYESALKWASKAGRADLGLEMRLQSMFMRWATKNPTRAVEAMKKSSLSEQRQNRVLEIVDRARGAGNAGARGRGGYREIMEAMRTDPKAAMKLVEAMADGREKEMMLRAVQSHLDRQDPKGALNQLATMPEGEAKTERLRTLAMLLNRQGEHQAALELAEKLQVRWKERLLDQIIRSWLKSSPEAALQALEKCSLPDEKKEFYRKAFSTE